MPIPSIPSEWALTSILVRCGSEYKKGLLSLCSLAVIKCPEIWGVRETFEVTCPVLPTGLISNVWLYFTQCKTRATQDELWVPPSKLTDLPNRMLILLFDLIFLFLDDFIPWYCFPLSSAPSPLVKSLNIADHGHFRESHKGSAWKRPHWVTWSNLSAPEGSSQSTWHGIATRQCPDLLSITNTAFLSNRIYQERNMMVSFSASTILKADGVENTITWTEYFVRQIWEICNLHCPLKCVPLFLIT